MFTRFICAAAVTAMLLSPHSASAQRFGISAGVSAPRGELADESSTGFNVNGMFNAASPSSPIGFRAEAGFNQFSLKGTTIGTTRIVNLAGNIVVSTPGFTGLHPYFIGGVGAYRVNYSSGNKGILYPQTPVGGVGRNGTDDRLGFNVGVGASLAIGRFGGLIEARYVSLDAAREHPSAPFVPISVGILF